MKLNEIKKTITSLTGVGPSAAKLFAKLGVFTIADLLTFYPRAYDDRTGKALFNEFREKKIHCIAIVVKHEWFGYGKMKTLKLCLSDGMLEAELIAFNRSFMQTQFPVGSVVCVSGIFSVRYGKLQSTAFELIKLSSSGKISDFENTPLPDAKVFPIYHLTEGLRQKNVRKIILQALNEYGNGIDDEISESIILNRGLLSKKDAIRKIHIPENYNDIQEARKTLVYEELFSFQYTLAKRAIIHKGALPNISLEDNSSQTTKTQNISNEAFEKNLSPLQKDFLQNIPFQLTSDQKNVIFQMNCDIDKGFKEREEILIGNENAKKVPFTMARLLQGDVGSGKTLVAFFACLRIISWKGQCAIMAPTEILAKQHAEEAAKLFSPLGVRVAFLSGNVKSKGRAELLKQLQDGNIDIIIGTHALFSSAVIYNDLQLAVIDEQHRFGVLQRQSIIEKGRKIEGSSSYTLHLLMMSATPIPQTLALTLFGDLDVSTLKTMPEGRKQITTYLVKEGNEQNAYEAVRNELKKGHQAYFVYPAIEDDAKDVFFDDEEPTSNDNIHSQQNGRHLKSAEKMFTHLKDNVYKEYRCALIHSKIDEKEKEIILNDFRAGKINVLAATTVIEVGVNVPNATCMVIEEADRFGLAALHQLRGRVGRSHLQSFCFLIYSKHINQNGIERMKVIRESTDGFYIAEQDLKLRGPGEINGTVQAGVLQFNLADIKKDYPTLLIAREDAFKQAASEKVKVHF